MREIERKFLQYWIIENVDCKKIFCKELGISLSTLSNLLRSTQSISLQMADKLVKISKGKLRYEELCPHIFSKERIEIIKYGWFD